MLSGTYVVPNKSTWDVSDGRMNAHEAFTHPRSLHTYFLARKRHVRISRPTYGEVLLEAAVFALIFHYRLNIRTGMYTCR